MKTKLFVVAGALAAMAWAAPIIGAAHFHQRRPASPETNYSPRPVRFRIDRDRGLLMRAWIDGSGPYLFVLDTGAGMNAISQRIVTAARLQARIVSPTTVGGLSSSGVTSNREAVIENLALDQPGNKLGSKQTALVVSNFPPDIDGIIDPTLAYAPYGYSIDMQSGQLAALDSSGLQAERRPATESSRVSWVRQPDDMRPYVRLGDGRIALIDTGSRFGLAVNERGAIIVGNHEGQNLSTARDLAGGLIRSRRVQPTTITIGDLVLRRIPTDILLGVRDQAPLILGRDALRPFRISFDEQRRLIEFTASTSISAKVD